MEINGKKFTKKYIESIFRSKSLTKVVRLFCEIYGLKDITLQENYYSKTKEGLKLSQFIKEFSPTKKLRSFYYMARREKIPYRIYARNYCDFYSNNRRHFALAMLKEEMSRPIDNYSKQPMLGHTHLYFCSPIYGHNDYNKRKMLEIRGNERFCDLLVSVGNKYFSK